MKLFSDRNFKTTITFLRTFFIFKFLISRFVEDLKKQPTPEFKPETGEFINKNLRKVFKVFKVFISKPQCVNGN